MKKVIIEFIYEEVKGKNDNYYRDITFDNIYNQDDVIDISQCEVKDV